MKKLLNIAAVLIASLVLFASCANGDIAPAEYKKPTLKAELTKQWATVGFKVDKKTESVEFEFLGKPTTASYQINVVSDLQDKFKDKDGYDGYYTEYCGIDTVVKIDMTEIVDKMKAKGAKPARVDIQATADGVPALKIVSITKDGEAVTEFVDDGYSGSKIVDLTK